MDLELVSALEKASSPVQSQRKTGEAELFQLEANPDFCVLLASLLQKETLSDNSRYLALIYLKNQIDRKWRRPRVFSLENKKKVRDILLKSIILPSIVPHLSMVKQLAVMIAEVGRQDFPRQWPNLLSDLQSMVLHYAPSAVSGSNAESQTCLDAVLEIMHQTLKKLGTARFGLARTQLDLFSVENIGIYWELFKQFQQYKALKICGTLLCMGNPRAHKFDQPRLVVHELAHALKSFDPEQNINLACRVAKIFNSLAEKNPLVFAGFGEDSAITGRYYLELLISNAQNSSFIEPKLLVLSMSIVREMARFIQYESINPASYPISIRSRNETEKQEFGSMLETMKTVFHDQSNAPGQNGVLSLLVQALIHRYFALTQDDLDLWRDSPEEFVIEESAQNPTISVVLCAELLFAHVLKTWPSEVAQLAQNLIEEAVGSGNELRTEAALRALQFGALTFSKSFEIGPVVTHLASIQGVNSESPLIRRRLCLVIGGWIPVNSSSKLQEMAFNLVRSTLQDPKWDIVVRLGAIELAGICCDDVEFDASLFPIIAEPLLSTIYSLLQAPNSSTEIKLHVLKTLSLVIEGMSERFSDEDILRVLEILPSLWSSETEKSDHHLVQGAVLQTLSEVVNACTSRQSQKNCIDQVYLIGVPLVDVSTDPKQPLAQYLMDDALTLWKALLVNAQRTYEGLSTLFERCVTLIESNTEDLGLHLAILESYIWLDYTLAVPYYSRLFSNFSLYLGDGCPFNDSLIMLLCTEILLNVSDGTQEVPALQQSGLLQWAIQCVLRADDEDAQMETIIQASKCLNILSLVTVKGMGHGIIENAIDWRSICPTWLKMISGMSDPRDRKLGCMGTTALLVAHPSLFGEFSSLYVDTLSRVVEEVPDAGDASQFYHHDLTDSMTAEEARQFLARQNEIAVRVGLKDYIREAAVHIQNMDNGRFLEVMSSIGIA